MLCTSYYIYMYHPSVCTRVKTRQNHNNNLYIEEDQVHTPAHMGSITTYNTNAELVPRKNAIFLTKIGYQG